MQMTETPDEAGGFRDEAAFAPLHPDQVKVLRVRFALVLAVLLVPFGVLDIGPLREAPVPQGLVPGLWAALAVVLAVLLPKRRYRAWGYRESADELHIKHGLFKRMITVVPFGRVQHIDTAQGPVERRYGLAELTLHTAGTRGASVSLPGLAQADAEALRDRIRAQIRQDLV